jgi:hypothetical protein
MIRGRSWSGFPGEVPIGFGKQGSVFVRSVCVGRMEMRPGTSELWLTGIYNRIRPSLAYSGFDRCSFDGRRPGCLRPSRYWAAFMKFRW